MPSQVIFGALLITQLIKSRFEAFLVLKKFGNSFCLIQHVQIRLEHISKHFYQKMPSQVTFSGFPASLCAIRLNLDFNHMAHWK